MHCKTKMTRENAFLSPLSSGSISDESDFDDLSSEIEFQLYSQVHYSSDLSHVLSEEHTEEPKATMEIETRSTSKSFWLEMTDSNMFVKRPDTENKNVPEIKHKRNKDEEECMKEFSFPEMKEESLISKDDQLSSAEDVDFIPESWEILDCSQSTDSDDQGLDIHISEPQADSDPDRWTPAKAPPSCWEIDKADRKLSAPVAKSRYYSEKKNGMRCRNCDECGHKAIDCTEPKKQQACYQCGVRGHRGRECPENESLIRRGRGMDCNRCGQEGHIRIDCPDLWRQFHITTKPGPIVVPSIPVKMNDNIQCYNCAKSGHFGYECERKRFQNFFSLLSPFVYRYDKRAVVKVEDLRKKLKSKKKNNTAEVHCGEQDGSGGKSETDYTRSSASKVNGSFFHKAVKNVADKFVNTFNKKPAKRKWEEDSVEKKSFNKKRKFTDNWDDAKTNIRKFDQNYNKKGHFHERHAGFDHRSRRVTFSEDAVPYSSGDGNPRKRYNSKSKYPNTGHAGIAKDSRKHGYSKDQNYYPDKSNRSKTDRGFRRRFFQKNE